MQNIKKKYAEAKDWCRQDFGRCYQIMIDTEDGDIWLDVFVSENNWKIYKSQTIQNLHAEQFAHKACEHQGKHDRKGKEPGTEQFFEKFSYYL